MEGLTHQGSKTNLEIRKAIGLSRRCQRRQNTVIEGVIIQKVCTGDVYKRQIEYGIYFRTASNYTTAYGSNSIIIDVPEQTRFSLTFNSPVTNTEGTATITVVKLNRTSLTG